MNRRDLFKTLSGIAGIPAVKSVEALKAQPGDVIVLKFPDRLSQNAVQHIMEAMHEKFPYQKILLLDGGIEIEVVKQS